MYPDLDRTFLFCFIRETQPRALVEIGGGESTKVALKAIEENRLDGVDAVHTVIEPYRSSEIPKGVRLLVKELQDTDLSVFDELKSGDILFIDSSHVIMPYGDTLTELLLLLPRLNTGVVVHIHDIFLPYDYPDFGMNKEGNKDVRLYTEQWALLLMLYGASEEWEVVWGSRFMMVQHSDVLLQMQHYPGKRPTGAAFWIRKLGKPLRG